MKWDAYMGIRSYFINRMEKAYWEDKKTLLDKYLKRMYVKKVIKGGVFLYWKSARV